MYCLYEPPIVSKQDMTPDCAWWMYFPVKEWMVLKLFSSVCIPYKERLRHQWLTLNHPPFNAMLDVLTGRRQTRKLSQIIIPSCGRLGLRGTSAPSSQMDVLDMTLNWIRWKGYRLGSLKCVKSPPFFSSFRSILTWNNCTL